MLVQEYTSFGQGNLECVHGEIWKKIKWKTFFEIWMLDLYRYDNDQLGVSYNCKAQGPLSRPG